MTRDISIMTTASPKTMHDFGGFARELYEIGYPAPDHPELAQAAGVAATDAPVSVLPGGMTHGVLSMESYLFGAVDAATVPRAPCNVVADVASGA